MEAFEGRRSRWGKAIEDVLVEVSQERNDAGLVFGINVNPVMSEFNNLMELLSDSHQFSRLNPNKAALIPGNKHNEEQEI